MSALDMQGTYSVVLIVVSREVKRFDNLHRSVAIEKAKANKSAWLPFDGMLYKVTNVLVYNENREVELEVTSKSEDAKTPFVCSGCRDKWCITDTTMCVPDDTLLEDDTSVIEASEAYNHLMEG